MNVSAPKRRKLFSSGSQASGAVIQAETTRRFPGRGKKERRAEGGFRLVRRQLEKRFGELPLWVEERLPIVLCLSLSRKGSGFWKRRVLEACFEHRHLPDEGLHWGAARLLNSLVVIPAPTGIGDDVEKVSNYGAVSGLAQPRSVCFQHLLIPQIEREFHDTRWIGSILHGEKGIAVHV